MEIGNLRNPSPNPRAHLPEVIYRVVARYPEGRAYGKPKGGNFTAFAGAQNRARKIRMHAGSAYIYVSWVDWEEVDEDEQAAA